MTAIAKVHTAQTRQAHRQTAHIDRFVIEQEPPLAEFPDFLLSGDDWQLPETINVAADLLDRWIEAGEGCRPCMRTVSEVWSYEKLFETSNRIANVLTQDYGLVPGHRVLLQGPNTPLLIACWFAVVKAGGVVVTVMPLLKSTDLKPIILKGMMSLALVDERCVDEARKAASEDNPLQHVLSFNVETDALMDESKDLGLSQRSAKFETVLTQASDPVLLAFTSGTTGVPKAAIHYHRDVLLMNRSYVDHVIKATPEDVFIGSPPIGFTFGLGAFVTFPMSVGASTVLLEAGSPPNLAEAIEKTGATLCFTAPTAYRAMLRLEDAHDFSSLRFCVSAGEHLPLSVFEEWEEKTGVTILNLLGSTEMFHSFVCMRPDHIVPGAVGTPAPGYEACILSEDLEPLGDNETGLLAVRGPTGCRYLDDARQSVYVRNGWNVTGDLFYRCDQGFYWFVARGDEMIISSGYNIAGVEIEAVLLDHPAVKEVGVTGLPDEERGSVVSAFIVLNSGYEGSEDLTETLKNYVKGAIAPYKYPRRIFYHDALPKTSTGKLQRRKLAATIGL